MKSEFNELELSPEQRMHALLCAHVLGELEGDERAEVDAALERSADLRAERARLEATVGVVSGVLVQTSQVTLSSSATEKLEAAVARNVPRAWYQATWVRAAAAVTVVAGAALLANEWSTLRQGESKKLELALDDGEPIAQAPQSQSEGASEKYKALDGAVVGAVVGGAVSSGNGTETKAIAPGRAAPAGDPGIVGADFERMRSHVEGATAEVDPTHGLEDQLRMLRDQSGTPTQDARGTEVRLIAPDPANIAAGEPAQELSKQDGVIDSLSMAPPAPTAAAPSTPGASRPTGGGKKGESPIEPRSRLAPAMGAPAAPGANAPAPTRETRKLGFDDKSVAGDEPGTWAGLPASELFSEVDRDALVDTPALLDAEEEVLGEELAKDRRDDRSLDDGGRRGAVSRQALEVRRLRLLEQSCRLRPNESPRDMFFRFWGDNPFELTVLDRLSTFSADVDTASYALARRYLVDGHLPTKEQIRTEEFVNYFKGDVAPPSEGTFRVAMELAPSLFGDSSDTWMLRVALRGREVQKRERTPLALNFVIDVSGSMKEENRLELVKHALRLLVAQLDARDTISLVKFSNDAALVLPPTSAKNKELIESAIHPLQPEGSTNTEAGLRMGYAQAAAALTQGSSNRVVLLTDGVANVGITDPNSLLVMVDSSRRQGILLNTVGVGMDNHNDNLLEQLADKGDGICNYVDDEQEVRRALVDNFTGAFESIARDVKLQVEFDPAQVERYRLLGYENRAVADADFRNAKVDAGEVGAGHQVVALYEVVRRGGANPDGPLAVARVRWKAPYRNGIAGAQREHEPLSELGYADGTARESELEARINAREALGSYASASAGYRRAVLVAQFAEFLRRSVHARKDSLDQLIRESEALAATMRDAEFDEFVSLVKKSRELVVAEMRRRDWLDDCADLLHHNRYLREQVDDLRRRLGEERHAEELERQMRELDRRLDELRRRVEGAQQALDRGAFEELAAENVELQRRVIELIGRLAERQR